MKEGGVWMVVSLFITCVCAALLLAQVYAVTQPRIQYQRQVAAVREAFGAVLPDADRFQPATPDSAVWFAYVKDRRIGTIIRAARQGYGGPVPVTAGVDLTGRIIAIRVAGSQEGLKETPGLGLKATEERFRDQFRGKSAAELRLKKDGGTIEAITGATITSRAVTDGLREALERYQDLILNKENE